MLNHPHCALYASQKISVGIAIDHWLKQWQLGCSHAACAGSACSLLEASVLGEKIVRVCHCLELERVARYILQHDEDCDCVNAWFRQLLYSYTGTASGSLLIDV